MYTIIMALITILLKALFEWRASNRKILFLEEQARINFQMRQVIAKTSIDRFLILKLTNGADDLIDGVFKHYKATAIDEAHRDIHVSVMGLYQQLPVDDEYQKMVLKAYLKKYYEFVTDFEPECDLKIIYLKEGIKWARIYFIFIEGSVYYFASVASYTGTDLTKADEYLIDTTIGNIRKSYAAYYK